MAGENNNRNLMISGIGSTGGGDVHTARIDGIGKVEGDLNCTDFSCNGKADIRGSVHASRKAEIHGTANIQGDFHSERIGIHGNASVQGDCIGEHIEIHGMATVQGKCEAEGFEANGRVQLGMLNAGSIRITMHGNSSIGEIGGEHIEIRKQPGIDFAKWLKALPIQLGNKLSAKIIEGDEVYVEYTTADVVRGNNITIGPGCEIGLVEHKSNFTHDPSSHIRKVERV